MCWGSNLISGEAGVCKVSQPSQIPFDAMEIAGGREFMEGFVCFVTTEGSVRCWGDNYYGQLGDGTTEARSQPVTVQGF